MSRAVRICAIASLAFSTAVGLASWAAAQDKPGRQTPQNVVRPDQASTISDFDRKFTKEAFAGNMAEVALGQLVRDKARDDQVKEFGERLLQDHQAANEKLAPIATKHQIELPASPDREAQSIHDRLAKLSGSQFDRQFVQEAVRDHQKDLDKYAKALSEIRNPELRAYADQTVPTLRHHLQMAQQISRALTPVASRSPQREPMSGATQSTREPPDATALLNNLSADGYRVTSDFSQAGGNWTARAERNGEQVTISYDPQTRQYREQ